MSAALPLMVDPASSCRVTLLFILMVFLDSYVPEGKRTIPPPAVLAAEMALLMAPVSLVEPLPTAP